MKKLYGSDSGEFLFIVFLQAATSNVRQKADVKCLMGNGLSVPKTTKTSKLILIMENNNLQMFNVTQTF